MTVHRVAALDKIADFEQAWDVWAPVVYQVTQFRLESAITTKKYRKFAKNIALTRDDKVSAAEKVRNEAYEAVDLIKKHLAALETTMNHTMQPEFGDAIR